MCCSSDVLPCKLLFTGPVYPSSPLLSAYIRAPSKEVPGAFELPLATQSIAENESVSSVISLGAIIQGDTPHFDFISNACIEGLQTVALKTNVPIICGVLTTNTIEQAIERSNPDKMNKGKEFALSAMNMVSVLD